MTRVWMPQPTTCRVGRACRWTRRAWGCKSGRMGYADLKNDVVFRKVFGQHPRVLAGLLNDLLERSGDSTIVEIEYLPGEQFPPLLGMKLSILDVRCREKGGATFLVEMQVLYVTGFLNRVVYNACKAYVGALQKGSAYGELVDVMAVSICDFALWSDAERDALGLARVPLVSQRALRGRPRARAVPPVRGETLRTNRCSVDYEHAVGWYLTGATRWSSYPPIATGWFPAAVLVATEHPWSLSALWRPVNLSGSYLGDVFYPAVSQLHAHFFVPHMTNPSAPTINARASVWSPVSPEHEP